jgi:hypothetical protein
MVRNTLQIIPLRHHCCAITKSKGLCKKSGTEVLHGKHYCWMHQRRLDKTYKPPKRVEKDLIKIDSKHDECSICYNLLNDPADIAITNCEHVYHFKCLEKWQNVQSSHFARTCPYCRKRLTMLRASNKKKKVVMTNMDVKVNIITCT